MDPKGISLSLADMNKDSDSVSRPREEEKPEELKYNGALEKTE
jgi:hypothetical protein